MVIKSTPPRKNRRMDCLRSLLILARFSPDDKYARQRYLLKKRFGLLPTQQPPQKY
ncbi:unnamed protein product [Linum tenue]|uniref:Nucleolar protein 10 n=1 Tax=Linum tenue TaxID=586396 RepID=A0AAV0HLK7_9ROSI|nr:unnamed protein product [Linum tenue]